MIGHALYHLRLRRGMLCLNSEFQQIMITLFNFTFYFTLLVGGAFVQWFLKAVYLESRRSRIRTQLWHIQASKKKSFVKIKYCGEPPWPRWRARPQRDRARILNSIYGKQWHLIHLTIFSRFSWFSLAYMCTKVVWNPIYLISHQWCECRASYRIAR